MKKLKPNFFTDTYLSDALISKITFHVVNIAYYHTHEEKLLKDIKSFDPTVLAINWCFSVNSDVAWGNDRNTAANLFDMSHFRVIRKQFLKFII